MWLIIDMSQRSNGVVVYIDGLYDNVASAILGIVFCVFDDL